MFLEEKIENLEKKVFELELHSHILDKNNNEIQLEDIVKAILERLGIDFDNISEEVVVHFNK